MAKRISTASASSKELEAETARMELKLKKLKEEREKILAKMDTSSGKSRWASAAPDKGPLRPTARPPVAAEMDAGAGFTNTHTLSHLAHPAITNPTAPTTATHTLKLARPATAGRRDLVASDAPSWSTSQVVDWLSVLGLEKYAPAFTDNEVNGSVLLDINNGDLDYMGIKPLAHRKMIMKAVSQLREASGVAASMPDSAPAPAYTSDTSAVASESTNNGSPKKAEVVHWSHLEPISDRVVEGTDAREASTTGSTLMDGAYDEAAEAAAFKSAVMAWRIAKKQAHPEAKQDAQEEGGGMWSNPFAAAGKVDDDEEERKAFQAAVAEWRQIPTGKITIVREYESKPKIAAGAGDPSETLSSLRDGVYDEEAERKAFQDAVAAWRSGKPASEPVADSNTHSVETDTPHTASAALGGEKRSCYHCFKVFFSGSGFQPSVEDTETEAAISGVRLGDKSFCSMTCYDATRIALALLNAETKEPPQASKPPSLEASNDNQRKIEQLRKLIDSPENADDATPFPSPEPIKTVAPAAEMRETDVVAFGTGQLRASPIALNEDPLATALRSAESAGKSAASVTVRAKASAPPEQPSAAAELKTDTAPKVIPIDVWNTDFNEFI